MLATIRDDTWNMLNMQHMIPNSRKWDYSDLSGGGRKNIFEGGHHLIKAPNPIHKQVHKHTHE